MTDERDGRRPTGSAAFLVPRASVVIPAHNEAAVIERTLTTLLADAQPGEFEVVVVPNGCTDDTAERARGVAGVHVEEVTTPSKIAALRRGDEVATAFPRIYLDGDVELSTAAARALADALRAEDALAAGIPGVLRYDDSSLGARLFMEFRQRLPVLQRGIIGAGVYAMSGAGRDRFGVWPEVSGDDQFVMRLFAPQERVTVPGHHTVVDAPPDLRTIVRRGLRVRRGNRQLSRGGEDHQPLPAPSAGTRAALRASLRTPRGVASAAVFVAVTLTIRVLDRVGRTGDW